MKLCDELCMKSMPFWGNLKKNTPTLLLLLLLLSEAKYENENCCCLITNCENAIRRRMCAHCSASIILNVHGHCYSPNQFLLFTFPLARKLYSSAKYFARKLLLELPELCVYSVAIHNAEYLFSWLGLAAFEVKTNEFV